MSRIASSRVSDPAQKLIQPGSASSLPRYLARVVEMRSYAWAAARRGLESENVTSSLGQLWLLLQPAITIVILWLVFDVVLDVSRGADNFIAFLTVGIIVFGHNQRGVLRGAAALSNSAAMLLSFSFPKVVLVLSQVLHAAASHRYALVVGAIALPLMGVNPAIAWLWMIPLSLLQVVFNFGLASLLARPATLFTDFRLALEYVFQILFYLSGVFFPASFFLADLENGDFYMQLAAFNPFYSFVELARWSLLETRPAFPGLMVLSIIGWSAILMVVGLVVFWRGEGELSGVKTIKLTAGA